MSCRSLSIGVALTLGSWVGLGAALAENRIALVIGNSTYQSVSVLPNPANDARAMTEFLTIRRLRGDFGRRSHTERYAPNDR